ncbi:hypothetical protein FHQ26_02995 [Testudinibacter sp. TR-2022]|uniref:Ig-like domain-containing protein n=1 Tax=Testudinibacter sp. TR-2022 TaxID=2585029 RepID=UPI00111A99BB|nr:Ig-like domain-containing protein [Testudinibacter sp. TR-2022]TNH02777.1 hypothetical protein FHQ22_09470 [Pasteurellaceae bacterium Phil31]TNH11576.1 hypothetical protein FHQ26_02995 [Testudinibacter sp. TR-2022]TNH11778.1 hypothetical protein FHQ25_02515 [Testudinibacter sp. TR-2022]TNH14933.1 hypothetical protein FIA56_04060 [Testudinibacter sp. TR-2022]TNH20382.1 hypothetical protein FHQ23_02185 [Testudinibacter sp. TR-2022]
MNLSFIENKLAQQTTLTTHARYKTTARPGEVYNLIDPETGMSPKDLEVSRQGDDLVLRSAEADIEVHIEGFWQHCLPGEQQCYAVLDTTGANITEIGQVTITQDGPVLEHLLAGQIGTLEASKAGIWLWVGAFTAGLLGAISAASSSSNGRSGNHENNQDTIAPDQPTAAINQAGTQLNGKTEANATVIAMLPDGSTPSTTADAEGNYIISLNPALTNGETVHVVAKDAAGNSSKPSVVNAADTTAPNSPTAEVSQDGKVVTGKAEPNSTVTIKDQVGNIIGIAKADTNGEYSVVLTNPQTNGQTITATATDVAGNTSGEASASAPDITAPAAPSIIVSDINPTDNTQTIRGKAEPGSTITLKDSDGKTIATVITNANGEYSYTTDKPFSNGEEITATASDTNNNSSSPAAANAPDTTSPNNPTNVMVSPEDGATVTGQAEPNSNITVKDEKGNIIGTGKTDAGGNFSINLTNPQTNGQTVSVTATDTSGNTSPSSNAKAPDLTAPDMPTGEISDDGTAVIGKAEPGSTVKIYDKDGNEIGTAIADNDGNYGPVTLKNGPYLSGDDIWANASDQSGNSSKNSAIHTKDTTAPAAPQATISNDGTTVSGKAEPNSTVTIKDATGNVLGTAIADVDGNYNVLLTTPQTNGQVLTATATDAAGNASLPTDVTAPDTSVPTAPTLAISSDGTTASGTAEPNSKVIIRDAQGNKIGEATADKDGNYTAPLFPNQTNGETLQATATDKAGNISEPTSATALDTTAPAAPTVTAISADGLTVTGKAEPNSTVTIKDATGNILGTAVTDKNGNYSVPLNAAQTNGQPLTATSTDASNNVSPETPFIANDSSAPATPAVAINQDGTTASGSAEPGSTVSIKDETGKEIGTTIADKDGKYSIPLNPALTNSEKVTATATDASGNTSPAATTTAPDSTAPEQPNAFISQDGATVSGTAEPNSTVTIKDKDGNVLGTATTKADGTYSIPLSKPQTDGQALTATATDNAGNTSKPAAVNAPDLTPPATPTSAGTLLDNVDTLNGTPLTEGNEQKITATSNNHSNDSTPSLVIPKAIADAAATDGNSLKLVVDGVAVDAVATQDAEGNTVLTPKEPLSDGQHSVSYLLQDKAGNQSDAAPATTFTVDTQAPEKPAAPTSYKDDLGSIKNDTSTAAATDDTTPGINIGEIPEGTTPKLYVDGVAVEAEITVNDDGTTTLTPKTALTDGAHNLAYSLTDAAGNESAVSDPIAITVDTAAPAKPAAPTSYQDNVGTQQSETSSATTTDDTTPGINIGKNLTDTPKLYDADGKEIPATYNPETGTLTPNSPLSEGENKLSYTLTDAAGNESEKSDPITINVDTTAPAKPATPSSYKDDAGLVKNDVSTAEKTDDSTPGINIGTVPAGTTPTLYVDGEKVEAEVTVNADGTTTLTPKTALEDGAHNITYTLTDTVGNTSEQSDPIAITVDTAAPAKPGAPTSYKDDVGSVTNNTSTAATTDDTTPGINIGIVPEGTTPKLYNSNGEEIPATYDATTGTLTPNSPLPEGENHLSYSLTNADGAESEKSDPITIAVDTTAPTTPTTAATVTDNVDASGAPLEPSETVINNGTTNDSTPSITIPKDQADQGTPQLVVDGKVVPSTVVTNADGSVTLTPTTPLDDGSHSLSYNLTDAAGNTSGNAPAVTATIDTKLSAISVTLPSNTSSEITPTELGTNTTVPVKVNFTTPTNVAVGDTVTVTDNAGNTRTVIVTQADIDAKGVTVQLPLPAEDGELVVNASITDPAGNSVEATEAKAVLNLLPPGTPIPQIDADTNNDGYINAAESTNINSKTTVTVSIPTEDGEGFSAAKAGDILTLYAADGTTELATHTLTDADITKGSHTFSDLVLPSNGTFEIKAKLADGALADPGWTAGTPGNDKVTIDSTLPTIAITSDITTVNSTTTATLTFTLSEASTDFILDDVIVSNGGSLSNFQKTGELTYTALFTPTANTEVTATVSIASGKFSDVAGNQNADGEEANNSVSITVDTIAPIQPTIKLANDSGENDSDGKTNDGTLTITADPTATTVVKATKTNGDTVEITPNGDGKYILPDGEYSNITITSTDDAGNENKANLDAVTVNSAKPILTSTAFEYDENRETDYAIGTVTDTTGSTIAQYRIVSGNESGYFEINPQTGAISLTAVGASATAASNDFETTPNSFTLVVNATDEMGNVSDNTNITITVKDVADEQKPTISSETFEYMENQNLSSTTASLNGVVGKITTAADDVGVVSYQFTETGNDTSADGFFKVDNNGNVTITAAGITNAETNDYETGKNSFIYGIQAKDAAGNVSDSADFTFTLLDNNAPVLPQTLIVNYFENALSSDSLGTVTATDADSVDVSGLKYYFVNSDGTTSTTSADGAYAIDGSNFRLTAQGGALESVSSAAATTPYNDYEAVGHPDNGFTGYKVIAIDPRGEKSAEMDVTFKVNNVIGVLRLDRYLSPTQGVNDDGTNSGNNMTSDENDKIYIGWTETGKLNVDYPDIGGNQNDPKQGLYTAGGDDFVQLYGSVGNSSGYVRTVDLGTGNDTFLVGSQIRQGAIINTGDGDDRIVVGNNLQTQGWAIGIREGAKVSMGNGDDYLEVTGNNGLQDNGTTVDMGDGNNIMKVGYVNNGSSVIFGSGNDQLTVTGDIGTGAGMASIKMGAGDDIVTLGGRDPDGIIDGGAGFDTIVLTSSQAGGNFYHLISTQSGSSQGGFIGFEKIVLQNNATVDIRYNDLLRDTTNEGPLHIQGGTANKVDLGANNWNSDGADKAKLDDNGSWSKSGTQQVADGITYDVWHHSNAGAETSNDVWIQTGVIVI